MVALGTLEPIDKNLELFKRLVADSERECISRSGITCKDTRGDGSDFDVVFLTAFHKAISSTRLEDLPTTTFKDELVNRFMIYQHEMIVQRQHFNWNWD